MAAKRKISIRKVLQMFVTLVATTCCIIAMVSASSIEDSKRLTGISVHIRNDKKYHFIQQKEILDLAVYNRDVDVEHTPISHLDVRSMEQVLLSDPWISGAQVYIDNERVLQLYITQRIPVARVFQQNAASYYVDTTLSIMPLSSSNIYYTTVVTNVPEIKNDSAGWALRQKIVSMVRHIQADSFWNAQIAQVIVDSANGFELMPMIGNQKIIFGDAVDMKEKFGNLFIFYKNVLNNIGWDKYETLDVRYKDQVIALPSLPYKGPVDKAIASMNWINSIVETEAVNDAKDSVHTAEVKETRAVAEKKRVEDKEVENKKTDKKIEGKKPDEKKNVKAIAQPKDGKKMAVQAASTPKKATPVIKSKAQIKKDKEKLHKKDKKKNPKYVYPEKKTAH